MDRRLQLGLGGIGVGVVVSTKSSPKLTFVLSAHLCPLESLLLALLVNLPRQVGSGGPMKLGCHGKWH
jgi:hypothetical protein